jgi:dihydroorotate dehydrogenase (NAD+) catalytic subunit
VQGAKLPFSTNPALAEAVMRGVRAATRKPIFAKLSPNVTDIGEIARAAEAGGADGITAVNTLLGMSVDWRTGRPGLATIMGGYSGVGVKPVALRCAWSCVRAVSIPVIGCGGVAGPDDVLEFLAVGCAAVQVGTSCFSDPANIGTLPARISALLDAAGMTSVQQVVGRVSAPARVPTSVVAAAGAGS